MAQVLPATTIHAVRSRIRECCSHSARRVSLLLVIFFLFGFNFRQPALNLIEACIAAAIGSDGGIDGVNHHHHKNDDQYQSSDGKKMFQLVPRYNPVFRLLVLGVAEWFG